MKNTKKIFFAMLILLVLVFAFFQQVEVVSAGRIAIYGMGLGYFRFSDDRTVLENLLLLPGMIDTILDPLEVFDLSMPNFWTTASQDVFTYSVFPWSPVSGDPSTQNCEACNDLRYGCNEYQCHTFGKACNITNAGEDGYEFCITMNPGDVEPPMITPMDSVLISNKYEYQPLGDSHPGDNGARIVYTPDNENGCVPPYTSITLGVNTSELAECRISLDRLNYPQTFEDMTEFFEQGNLNVYDHTLKLPSSLTMGEDALALLGYNTIEGLTHDFYIRCKDVMGNTNDVDFILSFCVQDGPYLIPPKIENIAIDSEFHDCGESVYVESGLTEKEITIFTNKPITNCSWDFYDTNYEQMVYGMDFCTNESLEYLSGYPGQYGCTGSLKGIDINDNNPFYIRCNDTSGNFNTQSCVINLQGTMPLQIDDIRINDLPNESTIKDSSDIIPVTIKVHTSSGAEEGKARCQYSNDDGENYYYFYNDGTFDYFTTNIQENLNLDATEQGEEYNYKIRCHDKAFNWVNSSIQFTLEKDMDPPLVVRAYHDSGSLKLVTNEYSNCVYSITEDTGCNYIFTDGTPISTQDGINHFIPWDSDVSFYVKCMDEFVNPPYPGNCSIIVRGSEEYS